MKTLRKSFGERVQHLRREAQISQEAFAERCGFARSYMSRIERGASSDTFDAIERLALAFGLSVEELFTGL